MAVDKTFKNDSTENTALYIHIPFCRQRCSYCNFVSYANREADIPAYIEALVKEIKIRVSKKRISSIYFGGGTPSLLNAKHIGQILENINSVASIAPDAEVTIEANPGTVNTKYLQDILSSGINRISIGIQSLDNNELTILGRIHSPEEAKKSFEDARIAGFKNINIDLIYGIPGQTMQSWQNTLKNIITLSPEHISLYPLTLEENTPLYNEIQEGKIFPLDSDLSADEYEFAEDVLNTSGYHHYEISNWAKKGYECKHNMVYWLCQPYIGIGVSSHSYINGHRLANIKELDKYISLLSQSKIDDFNIYQMDEEINQDLQLAEHIILGLRLLEGVSLNHINKKFKIDIMKYHGEQIVELERLGLLEYNNEYIRLTRRGRLLGNEVFLRFLPR